MEICRRQQENRTVPLSLLTGLGSKGLVVQDPAQTKTWKVFWQHQGTLEQGTRLPM